MKTAKHWIRLLEKHKVYTIVNLVGLIIGLAGFYILATFITNELSYDKNNRDLDRIYRINNRDLTTDVTYARTPYVLSRELRGAVGDGLDIVSMFHMSGCKVAKGTESFEEEEVYSADNSLFDILTFNILGGDNAAFLTTPNSVVISKSISMKYFGDDYSVGKVLTLMHNGGKTDLQVTGLFDDIPENSSFRPSILLSNELVLGLMDYLVISSSEKPLGREYYSSSWEMSILFTTIMKVSDNNTLSAVKTQLDKYEEEFYEANEAVEFFIQPYRDIYLGSAGIRATYVVGDKKLVKVYSLIAALLLITIVFNYVLLSIGVMKTRRKEFAIKYINGFSKRETLNRLIVENLVFAVVSAGLGMLIADSLMPYIGTILFGKEIVMGITVNWVLLLIIIAIPVLIGLCTGLILSFIPHSMKGWQVLDSSENYSGTGIGKKSIGVFQLIVAISIFICTLSVYSQINYFLKSDIGFDVNNIISLSISDNAVKEKYNTLKERFAAIPGVESVSGSMWAPPTRSNMTISLNRVDNPHEVVALQGLMVDYRFAGTLGLTFIEGRDFQEGIDPGEGVILNRSAVKTLGISGEATGTILSFGTVIGVVEDFHIHSYHKVVPPMLIHLMPQGVRTLLVRFRDAGNHEVLSRIEDEWKGIVPGSIMNYIFLKDSLEDLYSQEKRSASILLIFSILTLLVALLGIFGMASLNTIQRRKEVGIRKTFGAESNSLITSFILRYVLLSVVASIIAIPLAYLMISRWLAGFEFHGPIPIMSFIIPVLVVIVTVILTVLWNVVNAAKTNPVDTIRYS
jgi:putative ABC transport system permease protein